MASVIQIVNLALIALGEQEITSLDDNVKQAILSRQAWPFCRDYVNRSYPWSCLRKQATVSQIYKNLKPTKLFQLPTDCIRVLAVLEEYGNVQWNTHDNRTIYVDSEAATVNIQYVSKGEDTEHYDPALVMAQALFLAQYLCQALTQSANKRQDLYSQYVQCMREARAVDSQEGSMQRMTAETWQRSRIGPQDVVASSSDLWPMFP